jgi:2-dehydro-3-deoxyphosphogluconate aldolase/(4S)-4-hydroxy-2-oxoglutarate aldolase
MEKQKFSWELFNKMPIIGIIRNLSIEDIRYAMEVFVEAGFTNVEVTLNTKNATEAIAYLAQQYAGKINIGAGTVCTLSDLETATNAGAQFIVSPIVNKEVIVNSVTMGVPIFPGAFTPTEIYDAWSLGAPMVKVYPAGSLGPDYIASILSPLNTIKLLPTGGVHLNNAKAFMKAGASGLGVGGELFNKKIIASRDKNNLLAHFDLFKKEMEKN